MVAIELEILHLLIFEVKKCIQIQKCNARQKCFNKGSSVVSSS